MSRLPIPGSDDGSWGGILNDFLSVEHNSDGTLKASGSLSTKANDNAVVHNTTDETINGVKTFVSAPVVPSNAFPESAIANLSTDLSARLKYRGAWAATTAYAVNDVVTFSGMVYVVTTAFTSGASFSLTNLVALARRPGVYNVMEYGAKGDGTTDDTAAITAAISAAVTAGQANGTNYAEVYFPPAVYLISGNPTTGGATNGSAQIPIPVIPVTAQKFVLVLKGTADATALYHWQQTTPQEAGVVLRTTYNAGNTIPATGEVSVVGGPTPHFGYGSGGTFSNMLLTIDGITVEIPQNGNIGGFDLRGVAEANIWTASVLARSTVTGAPSIPSPNWSFGLYMPQTNNNDNCNIGYYSCEGLVYGLIITEHIQANSLRLINCFDGLVIWPSSGFPHRNVIAYASIENCTQCIVFASTATMKVDIQSVDIEWGTGHIINDSHNAAYGTIGIGSNGNDGSTLNTALSDATTGVNGGKFLKVVNLDQGVGSTTAPGIPSSTTALTNPFWRDAMVTITGGTVTGIAVDGVTQLVATPGTVLVPSGKTITLTYSSAPTWQWMLL
jgi:Pectate lyase superfamily protein